MSSSTATAPARKGPVPEETEFRRLAREMQSENGLDPIPPDQYLYFLGKKEPPLQRLLALVRSLTIRRGRRSAYCVDEHGHEVKMLHLEKLLEMDHGNFMRAWKEALERGLVRRGDPKHPHRVYLCGSVKESVGYKDYGVCTDTILLFLSTTQKGIYDGWPKERQVRFYADFDRSVKYKQQLEREAVALARQIGDRELDRVFAEHKLPKVRLATAPPQSSLLQLSLLPAAMVSVQTPSVPTPNGVSVQTKVSVSVPSGLSLLPLESRDARRESVGQSAPETPREGPTDRQIAALLLEEYGRKFPADTPKPKLCADVRAALDGAPLELLQIQIRQTLKRATSMGFALNLAEDVAQRWRADAKARAKAAAATEQHAQANEQQTRTLCQETLDDPRASDKDKEIARDVLKSMAAAGGAS